MLEGGRSGGPSLNHCSSIMSPDKHTGWNESVLFLWNVYMHNTVREQSVKGKVTWQPFVSQPEWLSRCASLIQHLRNSTQYSDNNNVRPGNSFCIFRSPDWPMSIWWEQQPSAGRYSDASYSYLLPTWIKPVKVSCWRIQITSSAWSYWRCSEACFDWPLTHCSFPMNWCTHKGHSNTRELW